MFSNSFGSLLDLVFVSQLSVHTALFPAVPEDHYHPALEIVLTPEVVLPVINSAHSYFDRADYASINNSLLSYSWADTISQLDSNG